MHIALGSILASFGHRIHAPIFGFGYIVTAGGTPV